MGAGLLKLALLLLVLSCGVVHAQPVGKPIEPGRRVRASILVPPGVDSTGFHSRDRITGSLLRYDASAITIEKRTVPWAAVAKLELSAGRHGNAGSGALIGALVGLLAGVVVGVTIGRDENAGEGGGDLEGEMGAGLGLAGLLAGAGIGAIIGGTHKSDDWVEVLLANGTRSAPADSSR